MKVLVVCILLTVSVASAAEVDFVRQRSNGAIQSAGGRPISVPVVNSAKHSAQNQQDGQKKRQLELPASGRQSGASTSGFRQQGAVPLQQPFRPAPSSARASPSGPSAGASRPEQLVNDQPQHAPSQAFVPFNEAREESARPQRQNHRPAAAFSAERKNPPASRGNPEFERGFPDGFTSGLPAFDFQGRMPEPDDKSEGFMDGALQNFPSLKTFGGFDPLPEIAREDTVGAPANKRTQSSFQGSGRPSGARPSSQFTGFRPSAN